MKTAPITIYNSVKSATHEAFQLPMENVPFSLRVRARASVFFIELGSSLAPPGFLPSLMAAIEEGDSDG